jgi:hypothetical protein
MNKNLLVKLAALALVLGAQAGVFACTVSITNDITNPVQVVEKEGKYAQMIMPNQSKQVGSTKFHANFYLFEMVNNEMILRYTVDQAACNLAKHQDITVTEIMNNTGDVAEYFTVTPANAPADVKPCCQH